MKKHLKLILICLSVAMLVSAMVGICASAEGEGTGVDILAQNVVIGEKVAIAYAVNADVADAESVTVEYYLASDPETVYKARLLDTSVSENLYVKNDVSYPAFATFGFAAYDFTDVVYATAYTGEAKPADAEYKKYSVGEYLYARLYKDGFIDKTEEDGEDFDRKTLYTSLIDYGTAAQKVLINNKLPEGESAEALLSDYAYNLAPVNVTLNGGSYVFTAPGEKITVGYVGEGEINGYHIYSAGNHSQTVARNGGTIVAYKNMSFVEAQYPMNIGFEDANTAVDQYGYMATPYESLTLTTVGDKTGDYFDMEVISDPVNAANKCLRTYVYSDGKYSTIRAASSSTLQYKLENPESEATDYVFESDIYISESVVNNDDIYRIFFYNAAGATAEKSSFFRNGGTDWINLCYNKVGDKIKVEAFKINTWVNLRIEIYFNEADTAIFRYFINNEFIADRTVTSTGGLSDYVVFSINRNKCGDRLFDNVVFRKVDLEYAAIQ